MKEIQGWDLVNEAGELKSLPAGAYICKIIEVTDIADKEYLDVYFDIADGEYKGYFGALQATSGKNYGRWARSYKQNALPFFKQFIRAVEISNANVNYKWAFDEKSLNGKYLVIVFRDEEYEKDGQIKVMAKPDEARSIQALKEGLIQIKPLKKLDHPVTPAVSAAPVELSDEDFPF